MARSSRDSPGRGVHVDFLPGSSHGLPGRLGLTGAPGRWRPGLDPTSDDLIRCDIEWLRDHLAASVVVTLLEEYEMKRYGLSDLRDEVRRAGLESLWLPVEDMWVPSSMEATAGLVASVLDRLSGGATVVVHCLGGLGRSGTVAACCLVACGRPPAEAVELVRRARPGAVEAPAQVAFVGRFAAVGISGGRES